MKDEKEKGKLLDDPRLIVASRRRWQAENRSPGVGIYPRVRARTTIEEEEEEDKEQVP